MTAPPPTATEAFKAGAEHYIRSSAPFQWAYTHLPALAEGDKAAGYTPLTEQQYQQRYGDSGFATAGSAAMGTLVAARRWRRGAELAAAPLAAYAAGGQLIRTAPQVIQTLPNGVQVLASQFIQRAANPLLQGAVRVGTNAVQGAIGAAATGGNLVSGAVGDISRPAGWQGTRLRRQQRSAGTIWPTISSSTPVCTAPGCCWDMSMAIC